METDEIVQVLQAYGADPSILEEYDCIPVRARQIHDMVKLRTQTDSRLLKRVDMSADRLHFVCEFTEYMHQQRFPSVPRFIRNRFNDPFVVHSTGLYYMSPWHTGREVDLRKQSNMVATVEVLASWHQAAKGFQPQTSKYPEFIGMETRLSKSLGEIRRWHETLHEKAEQTSFDQLFNACYEELSERINFCLSGLGQIGYRQLEADSLGNVEILHGNFRKQNILFDGAAYHVINYDRVSPGPQVMDLAMLLQRYMPAYDWNPDLVQAVTQRYGQQIGHMYWLEALAGLVTAPLRTMQVIQWYYNQVNSWEEEDYVDYLERSLELEELREVARDAILLLREKKFTNLGEGTDIAISPDSEFLASERLEPALAHEIQHVVDQEEGQGNAAVSPVSPGRSIAIDVVDSWSAEPADAGQDPSGLKRNRVNMEELSNSGRRKRLRTSRRRTKKPVRDEKAPRLWRGSISETDDT
jgi:CotS family spore coat protein